MCDIGNVILPHDLVVEILRRLPVKTLLRFMSVSKEWNSTITDPTFMSMHLTGCGGSSTRKTIGERSSKFEKQQQQTGVRFASSFRIVDSINGVLCLYDCDPDKSFRPSRADCIHLFNPSIRRSIKIHIPKVVIDITDASYIIRPNILTGGRYIIRLNTFHVALGFGFDAKTGDFKVIRIVYFSIASASPPLVQVYSVNDGAWRHVDPPSQGYVGHSDSNQEFMNGTIHWICYHVEETGTSRDYFLQVFDVGDETFRRMELPLCCRSAGALCVFKLKEWLSVATSSSPDGRSNIFRGSIWIMKEYGLAESWTHLFKLDHTGYNVSRIIGFRDSDYLLLVAKMPTFEEPERHRPVLYHPRTAQRTEDVAGIPMSDNRNKSMTLHSESLFLLDNAQSDRIPDSKAEDPANREQHISASHLALLSFMGFRGPMIDDPVPAQLTSALPKDVQ